MDKSKVTSFSGVDPSDLLEVLSKHGFEGCNPRKKVYIVRGEERPIKKTGNIIGDIDPVNIVKDLITSGYTGLVSIVTHRPTDLWRYLQPSLNSFVVEKDERTDLLQDIDETIISMSVDIKNSGRDVALYFSPDGENIPYAYNNRVGGWPVAFDEGGDLMDFGSSGVSIDALLFLKSISHKEFAGLVPWVRVQFCPLESSNVFTRDVTKDTGEVVKETIVNSYNIPKIVRRLNGDPGFLDLSYLKNGKLNGFIKKLILHLLPNKTDRELTLDWLHHAIFSRAATALILVGQKGTGKNILVETILRPLVGSKYHKKTNKQTLEEKFNSPYKMSRIVLFDEVPLNDDVKIDNIKNLLNGQIGLEKKGQDIEDIKNYASSIFLHNDRSKMRLSTDDRRFSVPEITNTPMRGYNQAGGEFTDEEISEFCKAIDEEDVNSDHYKDLCLFYLFLRDRVPTLDRHQPIKNDYYFKVCDESMPGWQTMALRTIHSITKRDMVVPFGMIFSKEIDKRVKPETMKNFLDGYLRLGKYKLGKCVEMLTVPHEKRLKQGSGPSASRIWKDHGGFGLEIEPEYFDLFCNVVDTVAKDEDDKPDPSHKPIQQYHDPGPVKKPMIIGLHDEDNAEDLL